MIGNYIRNDMLGGSRGRTFDVQLQKQQSVLRALEYVGIILFNMYVSNLANANSVVMRMPQESQNAARSTQSDFVGATNFTICPEQFHHEALNRQRITKIASADHRCVLLNPFDCGDCYFLAESLDRRPCDTEGA